MSRKQKYTFIEIPDHSFDEWRDICEPGHYRIVDPYDLPPAIPDTLKAKCSHAVLVASGEVGTSTVWCMANLNRLDKKDNAIDQMPFGFVIQNEKCFPSGCLIDHGDWDVRTISLPGEVNTVTSSIIDDIVNNQLPAPEGTIGTFNEDNPHIKAFSVVVSEMKKHIKLPGA